MTVIDRSTLKDSYTIASELENYPYLFVCAFGCPGRIAARSIEDGINLEQRHICGEKVMKTPRNVNEYLLKSGGIARMWDMIDSYYDEFRRAGSADPDHEHRKARLGGMADMLHIAMHPYFASRDDVVQEVMARGRARDTGEEHYTPGIGWIAISPHDGGVPWGHAFGGGYTHNPAAMVDPPDGYPQELVDQHRMKLGFERQSDGSWKDNSDRRNDATKAKPASAYKPPAHLTPELVEKIKSQHAQGFDDKILLMGHNIKAADLKWALGQ